MVNNFTVDLFILARYRDRTVYVPNLWNKKNGLGPFFPSHFPLPRGKRHFFYGAKVVEKKNRFPLGLFFFKFFEFFSPYLEENA